MYSYLIFDSHYYLAEWKPLLEGQVYVVGGAFHPIAGQYQLPCGEGDFTVYRKDDMGFLTMFTRSSGISYTHPLVSVAHA